jgi:hypothetical protein
MSPTPTDRLFEDVPIDSTGVLQDSNGDEIVLKSKGTRDIALHLEGQDANGDESADAEATYQVDVGTLRTDGSIRWFSPSGYEYAGTTAISDGWVLPEERIRLRVTEAAAPDATADVYISQVQQCHFTNF